MLETKEQKRNFAVIVGLIIVLSVITFWRRTDFRYKDNTDYAKLNSQLTAEMYQKYLASLKIDPVASKAVFQQIITEEEIRKEVEKTLQTGQKIEIPKAENVKVANSKGQEPLVNYLKEATTVSWVLKNRAESANQLMFGKDKETSQDLILEAQKNINKLKEITVPAEAQELQKSQLVAYEAYLRLAQLSSSYAYAETQDPWPGMYKQYYIINEAMRTYTRELNSLSDKYKIAELSINLHYAEEETEGKGFSLIPKAHALFGIGDVSITVGDIPRIVREALQDGLESSFAQFMGQFVQKLLAKIEQNYLISNFLYYSDALISGQYADDYLNKYVADTFDRQIIRRMLPQFTCGQTDEQLRAVFEAKAQNYLGFDPRGLDPKDPNFNAKLARVGDFLAQPEGWQLYYQDLARLTQSEAEKAVTRELSSSGLKTPRDIGQKSISLSISGIVSSQRAALNAAMNLGISTAKNFVSQFVSSMVQTLMNQYVFRGATTVRGGTAIGVLKEQSTCLAAAQAQALVPLDATQYSAPNNTPTEEQLLEEQCQKFPDACRPKDNNIRGY